MEKKMSNALPPIPQDQIGENFKWREWFRNLGNYIQKAQGGGVIWPISQGGTGADTAVGARNNLGLGTMAVENSDNINVTGGTIDNTVIGATTPSTGKFTSLQATGTTILDTLTGYLKGTSGTVSAVTTIPNTDITGLGTMSTQNANNVAITGGNINNTAIGGTTPSTGKFTSVTDTGLTPTRVTYADTGGLLKDSANLTFDGTTLVSTGLQGPIGATTPNNGFFTNTLQRNGYTVKPNCYIEAYDLAASITLNTTPTLLTPASTGASSSGITYDNTTGVFTFAMEGDYSLSLFVNALASGGNKVVYIYAEKNTGSGWVVNPNSGKYYSLVSGQITQIAYANSVHRVAGEQTRYFIYTNSTAVSLQTQTLPSVTGVYVPAIRIQYS